MQGRSTSSSWCEGRNDRRRGQTRIKTGKSSATSTKTITRRRFLQGAAASGIVAGNRTEEAIGSAHDFWTADRDGAFGTDTPRPFIGWFMLLEDAPGSRTPVGASSPHFQLFPEFPRASYASRYDILCRKLVQEQLYTAASVIASPRDAIQSGEYTEFSELSSIRNLVSTFAAHIAAAGVDARHDRRGHRAGRRPLRSSHAALSPRCAAT